MRKIVGLVPDALMLAGGAAALAGLYVLTGLGWLLLIGGLVVGAVGFLLDNGWFSREH